MSKPFFFRSILALTLIAGVSACQSTGMPASEAPAPEVASVSMAETSALQVPTLMPRQPAQMPVDVIALRDGYLAANPDKQYLLLKGGSHRGVQFWPDGSVVWDTGARTPLPVQTKINFAEGNKLCVDPVNTWTGACIELFKTEKGRLKIYYKFGNDAKGKFIAKGIQL